MSVNMPPLDEVELVWGAWREAGKTTGSEPLRWSEIEAYGRINGMTRDEMILMHQMSEAYLEGMTLTHPLAIEPMDAQS